MTNKREHFIIEPANTANACVVWMHGLGADGKDFMGVVEQLGLPANHGIRFVFPSAPFMPVSINRGMRMRAWYDIYELDILRNEDEKGIQQSQQIIGSYIEEQAVAGIAYERIILGGFSQGGAMTLYTALRYGQKLGGAISLSAYMPLALSFNAQQYLANKKIPIFLAHGVFDPVVSFTWGQETRDLLLNAQYPVEWHTYPMPHIVCLEEITAMSSFIRRCLGYD